MVIVDTTVWVDHFRGLRNPQADFLDRELGRRPFGLTDMILCEILQGIREEQSAAVVLAELRKLDIFDSGGEEAAIAAARNFRVLRRRGHTVRRTIDCFIATFCISQGHSLLHRDRDFDSFERVLGLQVIHP